jgi:hypothetical protein
MVETPEPQTSLEKILKVENLKSSFDGSISEAEEKINF